MHNNIQQKPVPSVMKGSRKPRHSNFAFVRVLMTLLCSLVLVSPGHTSMGFTNQATFHRLSYMDNHIIYTPSGNLENTLVAQRDNATTKAECAVACLSEERCSSFFYYRTDKVCLMHSIVFLGADEAVSLPGVTYWQISQEGCPKGEGFILYRPLSLCIKYYSQAVFWKDANSTCANAGLQLLKIPDSSTSLQMYQFLRGSSSTRLQHVSIGAVDRAGTLQWTDGTTVTWTNWATNEPSHPNENCTTIAWFFYFKWNDVPCDTNPSAKYYFICQKVL